MGLQLITPPTVEPVTLAEVKAHCRISFGMQEPAPSAITAALIAPAAAGNVDNGAHRYLATFVTADGETQAGVVSAAVTVADKTANGKVSLSAIPLGGGAVTARKIYRTAAAGTTYMLLTTLADNTTTVYTDNTADSGLGAGAPSVNTTSDPLLWRFVKTARRTAEHLTNRAFLPQTWRLTMDRFPCWEDNPFEYGARRYQIKVPRPLLRSVAAGAFTYLDSAGDEQELVENTDFVIDLESEPGRIVPAFNTPWPTTQCTVNAVTLEYGAGYASAALVPEEAKSWILAHVASLDSERTAREIVERGSVQPNEYLDRLLDRITVYA